MKNSDVCLKPWTFSKLFHPKVVTMVKGWTPDRSTSAVIMVLIMCLKNSWSKTVYMDRYGDCFHGGPMEIEDESYTIKAHGGDAYDTLKCEITFKSVKEDKLCLSFKDFFINKCDVKLTAYSEKSASGTAMGTYTCRTPDIPDRVCSEGRYLTVLMSKQELSHEGYNFLLEVRKYSDNGIDAYIVSISVIVGVIVAVIVIIILTAVIIVCCCCKNSHPFNSSFRQKSSASCRTAYTDIPVQPSAPPLPSEDPPAYTEHPPPYSSSDAQQSTEQNAFV